MGLPKKGAEGKTEPWVGGAWICIVPPRPLDPDMSEPPPLDCPIKGTIIPLFDLEVLAGFLSLATWESPD